MSGSDDPGADVRSLGAEVEVVRASGRPRRLDAFETVFQVAVMSLKRALRGPRVLWVLAIVAFPATLSLLVAHQSENPVQQARIFFWAVSGIHFVIVVPAVALTLATAFPWPEAEEGTLTYWFTSPVPRWSILLGRFAAGLTVGLLALPLSVVAITLPLEAPEGVDLWRTALSAIAATWLGYPAYLALFTLVSTALRRGLVLGVVFILLENSLAVIRGAIQQLTIVNYMRGYLVPAVPPEFRKTARDAFFMDLDQAPGTGMVIGTCLTVAILGAGLSLLVVHVVEYRAKQTGSS